MQCCTAFTLMLFYHSPQFPIPPENMISQCRWQQMTEVVRIPVQSSQKLALVGREKSNGEAY